VNRGEIWWTDLPAPRGSEPGYRRPAIIVSDDGFNESRIGTIIVAIVTSNVRHAESAGNVFIKKRAGNGLDVDSVVNVSSLLTVDKYALLELCGAVTKNQLSEVDAGLRMVLGL
jgi:mRNA interferase MazF